MAAMCSCVGLLFASESITESIEDNCNVANDGEEERVNDESRLLYKRLLY